MSRRKLNKIAAKVGNYTTFEDVALDMKYLYDRCCKLERVRELAEFIYVDKINDHEWHGEDCPAETYDLLEGESPGECECGANAIRLALKEADE